MEMSSRNSGSEQLLFAPIVALRPVSTYKNLAYEEPRGANCACPGFIISESPLQSSRSTSPADSSGSAADVSSSASSPTVIKRVVRRNLNRQHPFRLPSLSPPRVGSRKATMQSRSVSESSSSLGNHSMSSPRVPSHKDIKQVEEGVKLYNGVRYCSQEDLANSSMHKRRKDEQDYSWSGDASSEEDTDIEKYVIHSQESSPCKAEDDDYQAWLRGVDRVPSASSDSTLKSCTTNRSGPWEVTLANELTKFYEEISEVDEKDESKDTLKKVEVKPEVQNPCADVEKSSTPKRTILDPMRRKSSASSSGPGIAARVMKDHIRQIERQSKHPVTNGLEILGNRPVTPNEVVMITPPPMIQAASNAKRHMAYIALENKPIMPNEADMSTPPPTIQPASNSKRHMIDVEQESPMESSPAVKTPRMLAFVNRPPMLAIPPSVIRRQSGWTRPSPMVTSPAVASPMAVSPAVSPMGMSSSVSPATMSSSVSPMAMSPSVYPSVKPPRKVQMPSPESTPLPCGLSATWFDTSDSETSIKTHRPFVAFPDYSVTLPPFAPGLIDTHCHLDFLFKRTEGRTSQPTTLSQYRKMVPEANFPGNFEGCVAIFCEPSVYHHPEQYTPILDEPGVWGAFGVHPHHAAKYNKQVETAMIKALQHPSVRAFGEIGLDYSNRNNCNQVVQRKVFEQQLMLAKRLQLPLVIHCRDADDDCLQLMQRHLPHDYLIHRHCFTNSWETAQRWLRAFPNLYIGLTPLVTYPSAKAVHEVAAKIPLGKLLLETDAPYFVPRKVSKKTCPVSHPGLVIHTAAQIVSLRNDTSLDKLLHIVRQNTHAMYRI